MLVALGLLFIVGVGGAQGAHHRVHDLVELTLADGGRVGHQAHLAHAGACQHGALEAQRVAQDLAKGGADQGAHVGRQAVLLKRPGDAGGVAGERHKPGVTGGNAARRRLKRGRGAHRGVGEHRHEPVEKGIAQLLDAHLVPLAQLCGQAADQLGVLRHGESPFPASSCPRFCRHRPGTPGNLPRPFRHEKEASRSRSRLQDASYVSPYAPSP